MTAYPELIRYPYQNRISSDNGILGNWLSRAVTKSHIPKSELIGTWLTEWLDGTSQAERNWLYLTTRGFAPIPNYPQYLRLNVSHDCVRPLPRIGLFHPLQHAGLSRPLRFAVHPSTIQSTHFTLWKWVPLPVSRSSAKLEEVRRKTLSQLNVRFYETD